MTYNVFGGTFNPAQYVSQGGYPMLIWKEDMISLFVPCDIFDLTSMRSAAPVASMAQTKPISYPYIKFI